MNTSYLMVNASAGDVLRQNSARKPSLAVVPFRARTHGGAAQIDLTITPDSAPWIHPVH
jgi:hypothetical protein